MSIDSDPREAPDSPPERHWCAAADRVADSRTRAAAQSRTVRVLEVDGAISPPLLTYLQRGLSDLDGTEALLFQLNTPGGAVNVTLEIIELFRNAPVPVIVYVGPAGAQAASAGTLVTLAGHASGMAPETIIGAASVVGLVGDLDETAQRKAQEDLTAVARSLTTRRGPDAVALAESTIIDATAVTAAEALESGFIDVIAADRADLLRQLDGLSVVVQQEPRVLRTADADETLFPMTAAERTLLALTDPGLLSILLALAVPLILIELRSPGGWVAGFTGVVCLGLALYGLGSISVNWLGLGLVAVAAVLFFLEFQTGSGILAVVGTLTLIAGLLVLFNSTERARLCAARPSPRRLRSALLSGSFFFFVAFKALRAQRRQPLTGAEGLLGQRAIVRKQFVAAGSRFEGTILVAGELWRARAATALEKGTPAIVRHKTGFLLDVEPVDE